ncbi:hypothetical protein LTR37_019016 [Vermiconidia calcicola]|uniref:Uncharacterized protein n=1 Tax=Vermiconidia calcicola TaxID=1690605 RepID=A0ACC3MFC1_9PEZI|nr:hypothetical protein LTR37_019016 [Vermiconidia calcicola]
MATAGVAPAFLGALVGCQLKKIAEVILPTKWAKCFAGLCPEATAQLETHLPPAPPTKEPVIRLVYYASKTPKTITEYSTTTISRIVPLPNGDRFETSSSGPSTPGSREYRYGRQELYVLLFILLVVVVILTGFVMWFRKPVKVGKTLKEVNDEIDYAPTSWPEMFARQKKKAEAADHRAKEAAKEVSVLQKTNKEQRTTINILKDSMPGLESTSKKYADVKPRYRALCTKHQTLEKDHEDLKKSVAESKKEATHLENENRELAATNGELVESSSKARGEKTAAEASLKALDGQYKSSFDQRVEEERVEIGKAAKQQFAHERTLAVREKAELSNEIGNLKTTNTDLEKKLVAAEQQFVREQTTAAQSKIETEGKIAATTTKSSDLESKLATVQQQLAHEQTTAAESKTETEEKVAAITAKSDEVESKLGEVEQQLARERATGAQSKTEADEQLAATTAKIHHFEHRCGSLEVDLKIEQAKTAGLEQALSELEEDYEELRGKRDKLNANFDVNADEAVEEAKAEISRLEARLARECHCRRGGVDGGDWDDDDHDEDESGDGSGGRDVKDEDSSDPSAGADPSGGQEEDPQDGGFPCDDAEQDWEAPTERTDSDQGLSVYDTAPSPPTPTDSPDLAQSLQPSSLTGDGDPEDDDEDEDDDSGEWDEYGPESGHDAEDGGNSDPLAEADPSGGQEEGLEGNRKPDHDGNPAAKWPSATQRRRILRRTADQRGSTSMQAGASSSKLPTALELDQARALSSMPIPGHGAQASQSGSAGWSSTAATGSGRSNTEAADAANTQPPRQLNKAAPDPKTLHGDAPVFTPYALQPQAANRPQALAAGSGAPAPPGTPSQAVSSSGYQATSSTGPSTTADASQAGRSGPTKKPRKRGGQGVELSGPSGSESRIGCIFEL